MRDADVSALSGPTLEAQATIQDAIADTGVKRFYPSEAGFHQIHRKSKIVWDISFSLKLESPMRLVLISVLSSIPINATS